MYKIAVSRYTVKRKIPYSDPFWPRFNAGFENQALHAPQIAECIWNGQPVTTQHAHNWRKIENYLCGQHLALDFDTEDERSTLPLLMKDKFISKYAAFLHTTISHTPEKPRARVFFVLDTPIMQPKNYVLSATALLWLFGTADPRCKDAVRFFYGAPNCEIELLGNELPMDVLKKLIREYQTTGQTERKRATRKDYLPRAEHKEVAEALKFIPPWQIDYDEWVQVLMGIHAEFGDGGYAMAESWADGHPGEVEQKWRSFKAEGNTMGAVTIATVFSIAKKFGWGGI